MSIVNGHIRFDARWSGSCQHHDELGLYRVVVTFRDRDFIGWGRTDLRAYALALRKVSDHILAKEKP